MRYWFGCRGKDYLYADKNTNGNFFFNNAILNNYINIKLTLPDATTLWLDTSGAQPVDLLFAFVLSSLITVNKQYFYNIL